MPNYLLCTIEELFDTSIGLLVEPDWTVTDSTQITGLDGFDAEVRLVTPDGNEKTCAGRFQSIHVNTFDKLDIRKRWRIVLSLKGVAMQDVPIGTQVLADEEAFHRIGHEPGEAVRAPR